MKEFGRLPLNLAPIPAERPGYRAESPVESIPSPHYDGFVDEAIVSSLLAPPKTQSAPAPSPDLGLSAEENDFTRSPSATSLPARLSPPSLLQPLLVRPAQIAKKVPLNRPRRRFGFWRATAITVAAGALLLSLSFAHLVDRTSVEQAMDSFSRPLDFIKSAFPKPAP